MPECDGALSIECWLDDVRKFFLERAPDLLPVFEIYAAEAIFGRRYISSDLEKLEKGTRILEIGAGSLILSCQLVREGFRVTSLEPIGTGFSHFEKMREVVLERGATSNCLPEIMDLKAENLDNRNCFDYAFSVNVMEHVDDVNRVLVNVGISLVARACYRFTCPNYWFPYEPHFNIPTLFSKRLTAKVFRRQIFACDTVADPVGTWESLNWISVNQVRRSVNRFPFLKATFNRRLLVSTFERITFDRHFSDRRSAMTRKVILVLVRLKLHELLRFVPAVLQPVMDCKLEKVAEPEAH